jgi:hypothetical protein
MDFPVGHNFAPYILPDQAQKYHSEKPVCFRLLHPSTARDAADFTENASDWHVSAVAASLGFDRYEVRNGRLVNVLRPT